MKIYPVKAHVWKRLGLFYNCYYQLQCNQHESVNVEYIFLLTLLLFKCYKSTFKFYPYDWKINTVQRFWDGWSFITQPPIRFAYIMRGFNRLIHMVNCDHTQQLSQVSCILTLYTLPAPSFNICSKDHSKASSWLEWESNSPNYQLYENLNLNSCILQRYAILSALQLNGQSFIVQKDNDPKYTWKLCRNYLAKNWSIDLNWWHGLYATSRP